MHEDIEAARDVLDALAPQMKAAGVGNFVLPHFVGSYQLVLDYARLRLLLAALDSGAPASTVAALASPPATTSPAVPVPPPTNGSGLIIPGNG